MDHEQTLTYLDFVLCDEVIEIQQITLSMCRHQMYWSFAFHEFRKYVSHRGN